MNQKTELHIDGQVAYLTLNQPDTHNAFDDEIIADLLTQLSDIDSNKSIRAMVLQAKGKHFCAGANLAWMKRMAQLDYGENLADAENLARLMAALNSLAIPTIARVQGAAYGGAIGLIACCDIAVASEKARFCLSEVKLGLSPATISPYVIAAMGARQCRRLFLTAEVFDAHQAEAYGLIHETVAMESLDQKIESLLSNILTAGPQALRASKQLIHDVSNSSGSDTEKLAQMTSELIAELRVSDEGQEGLTAFFEKRSPNWVVK